MSSQLIDFLVVGGGPAGCAFAMLAVRAGASVVLLERGDYGQPRPGEHLAGRVRPMLDLLGVPREEARAFVATSPGILSMWGSDEPLLKLYGTHGKPTGLCVLRHRFDELLCASARRAGVTVVSRGSPACIERRSTRAWDVRFAAAEGRLHALAARSIVDASGRSAVVARRQGARRINHGDLLAIVRWLDGADLPREAAPLLMVESCAYGWWSLSVVSGAVVASLYTSLSMIKASHATPERWWQDALGATQRIGAVVQECRPTSHATRVYRACPSRSSRMVGDRWIAIGEAAIAFDPLAGQGVALALETAFRAFEAATVDPSWALLGTDYHDALLSRLDAHLERRAHVYEEAAAVLSPSFIRSAVMARSGNGATASRTGTDLW